MRFLEKLNTLGAVVVVLAIAIALNGFFLYRYQQKLHNAGNYTATPEETTAIAGTAASENVVERTDEVAFRASVQEEIEAEYVASVGEIQEGSVEAFLSSDEKLLRPDSLTAADVEDMEDNTVALRNYAGQVENLGPPERYGDQHELLVAVIADLYGGAEIAYRLGTDPASATQSDYETYDLLVDRAATGLQRSNEILGEDYETIERTRGDVR